MSLFHWRLAVLALLASTLLGAGEESPSAGLSVLAIGANWQADTGESFPLRQLAGKPHVIAMFYSGCHMSCPLTVEALKWIEQNLAPRVVDETGFVLVTLDPGGDTAEELAGFRREANLSTRWTLLRGTRLATREMAEALGISFQQGTYRLSHSAAIVVLNAEGRIVSRHTTLRPDLHAVVQSVEALASR